MSKYSVFLVFSAAFLCLALAMRIRSWTDPERQKKQFEREVYTLLKREKLADAEARIQRIAILFPDWPELTWMQGLLLYYKALRSSDPVERWRGSMQSRRILRKYAQSREKSGHAGSAARAWHWIANEYASRGDYDSADSHYKRALADHPNLKLAMQNKDKVAAYLESLASRVQISEKDNLQHKLAKWVGQLRQVLGNYDHALAILQANDTAGPRPYPAQEWEKIQQEFWHNRIAHSQFPLAIMRYQKADAIRWTNTWVLQHSSKNKKNRQGVPEDQQGERNSKEEDSQILSSCLTDLQKQLQSVAQELEKFQQELPKDQVAARMIEESVKHIKESQKTLNQFWEGKDSLAMHLSSYRHIAEAGIALIIPPPQTKNPPPSDSTENPPTAPPPPQWIFSDLKKQERSKPLKNPDAAFPGW